jgi:hypothetical protein
LRNHSHTLVARRVQLLSISVYRGVTADLAVIDSFFGSFESSKTGRDGGQGDLLEIYMGEK